MKKRIAATLLCTMAVAFGQNAQRTQETATILNAGPHERLIERLAPFQDAQGRALVQTNRYTQVETGLNVWSEKEQAWVEASCEIELLDSGAVARNTQHQVYFPPTLEGAVQLVMPDGKQLKARVLGLAVADARDRSRNVFVAESIADTPGYLAEDDLIVYPGVLGGIADVSYRVSRWGLEQDITLRAQIEDPASSLGLDQAVVEVWTEILEGDEPELSMSAGGQSVDWGSMHLGHGRAFDLARKEDVPVLREWINVQGRRFIVEAIPYADLERLQADLPPTPDEARVNRDRAKEFLAKSSGHRYPPSVATARNPGELLLAGITRRSFPARQGVCIDWTAVLSTQTNYVFEALTYYISGPCTLSGTNTTFSAGAVPKYAPTNTASLTVNTPITWLASAYRPVIMTGRDDSTVGQSITNAPLSGYYANPALKITTGAPLLNNLRCSYATLGVFFYDTAGSGGGVAHAQFVQCQTPLQFNGYGSSFKTFVARNVLIQNCTSAFKGYSFNGTVEHLTLNTATRLAEDYNGQLYGTTSSLSVNNSLLVATTSYYGSRPVTINLNSPYTQVLSSGSGVWTAVGAGNHYLSPGSVHRNAGTTNINATLLGEIKKLTTYPPLLITADVVVPTTWGPQAIRDTDTPDLGFHYDPLDVAVNTLVVTNSTLTLTNGIAVGHYGNSGFWLKFGANLASEGSPTARNHITRYTCVQEQSVNWGSGSVSANVAVNPYTPSGTYPTATLRFTNFETPATDGYHLYESDGTSWVFGSVILKDCSFNAGTLQLSCSPGTSIEIVNNEIISGNTFLAGSVTLNAFNNLVASGILTLQSYGVGTWTLKDNAFDRCALYDFGAYTTNSHNAYIGGTARLQPNSPSDKVLSSFTYTNGPLGRFYQVSTSLINQGSIANAALRGMYHYTTTANQAKETTSALDIGLHYVAVDPVTERPLDYDSDGLADYFEDRDGDNTLDSGETNWQISENGTTGVPGLQVFTVLD